MQGLDRLSTALGSARALLSAGGSGSVRLAAAFAGPALRGFILRRGRNDACEVADGGARFRWDYRQRQPELARLYEAAKVSQWEAGARLDWSIAVDPENGGRDLVPAEYLPLEQLPGFHRLTQAEKTRQRLDLVSWLLSQFLHGEQGALNAASQVTASLEWTEAKLFGGTQVVDEARHVEVFHRYLTEKLGKLYPPDDNLYVILDALLSDGRWDLKFLGMQILVEGLALGAFGAIRATTREPLLRELLKAVITDEARHVHFGVLALRDYYVHELGERARREREDWAFEVVRLMRDRFLAHDFYEEHWAHALSRRAWDQIALASPLMELFQTAMLRRVIPNLKRIGLLSPRLRPHYEALGMLAWEGEPAAPELPVAALLGEAEAPQA